MFSTKRILVIVLAVVFVFGMTSSISATTLRLGSTQPSGHAENEALEHFAELVYEKTGGAVNVDIFPGGILGSNPAMMDSVYEGALQMGRFPPGTLGEYFGPMNLFSFYFLFESLNDITEVLNNPMIEQLEQDFLEETGVRVLGYIGFLERNIITTDTRIDNIDDLDGLTMRAWEWDPNISWWQKLGASPTVIAYSEVYTGLQAGVIDGAEGELSVFDTDGWAEVSDYIARTQHIFTIRPLVINEDAYSALSEEEQEALQEAAAAAEEFQLELSGRLNDELIDTLIEKYGIEITHPDKEPFVERSYELMAEYAEEYDLVEYVEGLFGLEIE